MLLRADQVNACEPNALVKGRYTETQSQQKLHDEKRRRAIHHADTYGDKTRLLIAVKLAERKCQEAKDDPALERGRILSDSHLACQAKKLH